jgi:hypothetical protein
MIIGHAFPSKFLKASDLGPLTPIVTIAKVVMETVGDDPRVVMYFVGKTKGLPLNRTNANTLEEITGSAETDTWIGLRIKLFVDKVEFQGRRVPALRIAAVLDAPQAPAQVGLSLKPTVQRLRMAPSPAPMATEYTDADNGVADNTPDEDDIPF